jgi:hypothetical protein
MSKPETIKIDEVEYVRKDSVAQVNGEYAIVRCRNAGVHAGYVEYRDGGVLRLRNSRRLWRWWSKFSLSGLAMEGPLKSKLSEQRYACVVPVLDLTDSDVCEVLYCTERARTAIEAVKEHSNE